MKYIHIISILLCMCCHLSAMQMVVPVPPQLEILEQLIKIENMNKSSLKEDDKWHQKYEALEKKMGEEKVVMQQVCQQEAFFKLKKAKDKLIDSYTTSSTWVDVQKALGIVIGVKAVGMVGSCPLLESIDPWYSLAGSLAMVSLASYCLIIKPSNSYAKKIDKLEELTLDEGDIQKYVTQASLPLKKRSDVARTIVTQKLKAALAAESEQKLLH